MKRVFSRAALSGVLALLASSWLLGTPVALAADPPAAILTASSGNVTIERAGKAVDATFGAPLQNGDVVRTGAKGKATILFPSGRVLEVDSSHAITVSASLAVEPEAELLLESPSLSAGEGQLYAQAASTDQGLAAVPMLRSGGNRLRAVSPAGTKVRLGRVQFRWTPVEDAMEYRVILSGPGSARIEQRTSEPAWAAEATPQFRPGDEWTWVIEAATADGPVTSEPVMFRIAAEEEAKALAAMEERMQPLLAEADPLRADTAAYLLGSTCRSLGFYADAILYLEQLAARHGDRVEIQRQLGDLYQAVGRNAEAIAAYRRALGH